MDIALGLDHTLGLSFAAAAQLAQEAARLGYDGLWTPETPGQYDSFQLCTHRWAASRGVVPEGLLTGIAVSPAGLRTPLALAMCAKTTSAFTGGRFVLGLGSGAIQDSACRRFLGLPGLGPADVSPLALMRNYLTRVRRLLAAELGLDAPHTPVYLGALGPDMLRLGGELADGVVLNWCTPEQVAWSRERIREGAARAGRDPAAVRVIAYIRVCVDSDVDRARRALGRAVLAYISPGRRQSPYRVHFERMAFGETLALIDRLCAGEVSIDAVVEALPPGFLRRIGYYGPAEPAAAAVRAFASSLDAAIVRVVPSRRGVEAAADTMLACQPSAVKRSPSA
ncbi:MAG: LLM class flavin-dependent oxidoreductase [Armatimonadota bacterium]